MLDTKELKQYARIKDSLYKAIQNNDVATVKQLFLTESSLKTCPAGFLKPAIKLGNLEVISLLLNQGALNNNESHFDLLYHALYTDNNVDIVALLLSQGAHINDDDGDGCTVLHFAVWQWNMKNDTLPNRYILIKLLLDAGANVNAQGNVCCCMEGFTPLHIAALWNHGDPKTVELLLEYKPDLTIKSTEGHTVVEELHKYNDRLEIKELINSYSKTC